MTRFNKIITIGVISAITVSCLTPFTASAETTQSDTFHSAAITKDIQNTEEEGQDAIIPFIGTSLDDAADTDFFDDIIFDGCTVSDDADYEIDYGDLTDEEIKELNKIYDRYEAIFTEILGDDDEEISDEELEARLQQYEAELEELEARATLLEEKAGWVIEWDDSEDIDWAELEDINLDGLEDLDWDELGNLFEGLIDEDFINGLTTRYGINADTDLEDITADQLIGITGEVLDNLKVDDLCKIIEGVDSEEMSAALTEAKAFIKSDEFKSIVETVMTFVNSIDEEN